MAHCPPPETIGIEYLLLFRYEAADAVMHRPRTTLAGLLDKVGRLEHYS
jgi:hypothetical protein